MEARLAKIISYLFHPLLMPTYGFLIIFSSENFITTSWSRKLIVIGITFTFTFLLPTVNALLLLKMGRIKSLEMEESSERFLPYFSTALYFFALVYLFHSVELPSVFIALILGAGVSIVLTWLINFKWKISAHAIGIGGMIGATIGFTLRTGMDLRYMLLMVILCAGLVGYARLKLNAHDPAQVYTGFGLGFTTVLGFVLFY